MQTAFSLNLQRGLDFKYKIQILIIKYLKFKITIYFDLPFNSEKKYCYENFENNFNLKQKKAALLRQPFKKD